MRSGGFVLSTYSNGIMIPSELKRCPAQHEPCCFSGKKLNPPRLFCEKRQDGKDNTGLRGITQRPGAPGVLGDTQNKASGHRRKIKNESPQISKLRNRKTKAALSWMELCHKRQDSGQRIISTRENDSGRRVFTQGN